MASKEARIITNEVMTQYIKDVYAFEVENRDLWDVEALREEALAYLRYDGYRFEYEQGHVKIIQLPEEIFLKYAIIKDEAFKKYRLRTKIKVENKLINELLAQLPGYKEVKQILPYRTKGSDTVIFMFPKDNPKKDFAGFEICDVLIYDRDYEEYFKVRTTNIGFTEIMCNRIAVRTGMTDGGYMVRLRENCLIQEIEGGKLYLKESDAEIYMQCTEQEMEEALNICYNKSLKEFV